MLKYENSKEYIDEGMKHIGHLYGFLTTVAAWHTKNGKTKDLNVDITKQEEKLFNKSQKIDLEAIIHFSQALEYEDQGDLKQAYENFREAIQIAPKFLQAQI